MFQIFELVIYHKRGQDQEQEVGHTIDVPLYVYIVKKHQGT